MAAKLRTERVRAPFLGKELRHVPVMGFVEEFEHRADRRNRLTLRVVAIGDLTDAERPYRVRISTAAKHARFKTGEAVSLRATGRIEPLPDAPKPPLNLRAWAAIDALRAAVNERVRLTLPNETGAVAVALVTGIRGGIRKR